MGIVKGLGEDAWHCRFLAPRQKGGNTGIGNSCKGGCWELTTSCGKKVGRLHVFGRRRGGGKNLHLIDKGGKFE